MLSIDKFNVRIVRNGDRYGRNMCLEHAGLEPLVEFYDARYPHTAYGQFVSRYYMSTLLEADWRGKALSLDGGIPEWTVSADDMTKVIDYLEVHNG
jgi:hypothetical protein